MKHRTARFLLFTAALLLAGVPRGVAEDAFVDQLRAQWEASRRQMVEIAEAIPQDKLGYKPTPEVRSFAGILTHVASENMTWMERMAEEPNPGSYERFEHLKTRPEILKALSDYFDYGAKVLAGLTDQKAMGSVPFGRRGPTPRWVIVTRAIGHSKEHYGNLVTYLRLNGIVPPSSRPRQQPGS